MIKNIKEGDFLSEQSHYRVLKLRNDGTAELRHTESNTDVTVSTSYIKELMVSADESLEEKKVN